MQGGGDVRRGVKVVVGVDGVGGELLDWNNGGIGRGGGVVGDGSCAIGGLSGFHGWWYDVLQRGLSDSQLLYYTYR